MRKLFFLTLLLIFHSISSAQTVTVDALRKEYYKVTSDSATCAKLYSKVCKDNSTDNIIIGYKGAIMAAMANHIKNKQEKLKLFNSGKKFIDQSVITDNENVELRFLRFTIQSNCPKALGYNNQLDSDKKFILDNLDSIKNSSLKKKMGSFLLESNYLSTAEKKRIPIDSN